MGIRDKIAGLVTYGPDGMPQPIGSSKGRPRHATRPPIPVPPQAATESDLASLEAKVDRMTDVLLELVDLLVEPMPTEEKAGPEAGPVEPPDTFVI